jgi:hypothetical protein
MNSSTSLLTGQVEQWGKDKILYMCVCGICGYVLNIYHISNEVWEKCLSVSSVPGSGWNCIENVKVWRLFGRFISFKATVEVLSKNQALKNAGIDLRIGQFSVVFTTSAWEKWTGQKSDLESISMEIG